MYTVILVYCQIVLLCWIVILVCCCINVLSYCHIVLLCCIVMLLYCDNVMLLYEYDNACCIVIMLYCCIVIFLYYHIVQSYCIVILLCCSRRLRWLDSERDSRKMTSKIAPSEKFSPNLTESCHRIVLSLLDFLILIPLCCMSMSIHCFISIFVGPLNTNCIKYQANQKWAKLELSLSRGKFKERKQEGLHQQGHLW